MKNLTASIWVYEEKENLDKFENLYQQIGVILNDFRPVKSLTDKELGKLRSTWPVMGVSDRVRYIQINIPYNEFRFLLALTEKLTE